MKIGYLSGHNPYDRSTFSGTSYYAFHALQRCDGISVTPLLTSYLRGWLSARSHGRISATTPLREEDLDSVDVVIAISASPEVSLARSMSDVPILHVTDATPSFLEEFYGENAGANFEVENATVHDATRIVYSSEYMSDLAQSEFGLDPARIATVPFGLNMDNSPTNVLSKPDPSPIRLLSIMSQFDRKGGPIAVETFRHLKAAGHPVEFQIIGDAPADLAPEEGLIISGYLSKAVSRERAQIEEALQRSHFLLLPTRADCTPMVIAEANSYSMPVLTTDVGGIPSLISEGRNGHMFSLEDGAAAYAERIIEDLSSPEHYQTLSASSFEVFRDTLNWDVWAAQMVAIARGLVDAGHKQLAG